MERLIWLMHTIKFIYILMIYIRQWLKPHLNYMNELLYLRDSIILLWSFRDTWIMFFMNILTNFAQYIRMTSLFIPIQQRNINNMFILSCKYFGIMISQYSLKNQFSLWITLNFVDTSYLLRILKQIPPSSRKLSIDQHQSQQLKSSNSII